MLPASYQLPAAAILLCGGIISCFFGYRLFRTVLAIFGFILGALAASSLFGISDTGLMLIAAVVGGLVGAFILIAAYFVGVALVGAGLGAVIANLVFSAGDRDPSVFIVILFSVAGAVGATYLQRYFIIVGTAFGGAWTMIVGTVNILATRGLARGASATEVWILYPTSVPGERWIPFAWIALGIAGVAVQLTTTAKGKKK